MRAALSFAPFKREVRAAVATAIADNVDDELTLICEAFGSTDRASNTLRPEFAATHGPTDALATSAKCPMLFRYDTERLPPCVRGKSPLAVHMVE